MSNINQEYLRFEKIKNTNYSDSANLRELVRWLNHRRYTVVAGTPLKWTPEGQKLFEAGIKEIDDMILELLNITR